MKSYNKPTEVLETRTGTTHTHVHEPKPFTVTELLSEVVYTLERNPYFTDWVVTGRDAQGNVHSFDIGRAGLTGESRFYGLFC